MPDMDPSWGTLGEALEQSSAELTAAGVASARRDSELLLLHILDVERSFLFAHPEYQLTEAQAAAYQQILSRRCRHEPIQYITGEREFYGLRFRVTADVLIPRPETEHLVEAALERTPEGSPFRIADVGTGSGAIAVALAVERPLAQVTALDISRAALKVAESNAAIHELADRIQFREADLLEGIADHSFDMVVSNPPYIADGERDTLDIEVRDYEPAGALFAGPTGLEIYERLIPRAARALRPGGWLLMEMGAGQQLQLRRLLEGWKEISVVPDLQGIARVMIARAPGS